MTDEQLKISWSKKDNSTGEYIQDLEELYAEQKRRQVTGGGV